MNPEKRLERIDENQKDPRLWRKEVGGRMTLEHFFIIYYSRPGKSNLLCILY